MMVNVYCCLQRKRVRIRWPICHILLLCVLLTGCVEKELTIDLPAAVGNPLAVLAVIDNGRPPSIQLSSVEQLDDQAIFYPVSHASVVLFENDLPLDTLGLLVDSLYPPTPSSYSVYYSNKTLELQEGSRYHLVVEAANFTPAISEDITYRRWIGNNLRLDTSVTQLDEFGVIGNVSITFETLEAVSEGEFVIVDGSEATRDAFDGANFTETQIIEYIQQSRIDFIPFRISESRNIIGEALPAGSYTATFNDRYLEITGQRLYLSVVNLSAHYLRFAEPFSRQSREDIGGLGTLPQKLPTNIRGGYGYFTVRDNQTIFLN